jgi:2-C-methyl-D-erythritol 4-phosphate cytidylyltransferase
VSGAPGAAPATRTHADVLGVVFGPETLGDVERRGRAAADLAHAGAGSVVQCRPGALRATLGDCAAAAQVILALDPARAVDSGALPAAVTALLAALSAAPDPLVTVVVAGPVTDTLKLVAGDGALLGTADREEHAALLSPVALTPRTLQAALVRLEGTDVAAVTPEVLLAAVADAGGTVVAVPPP